MVPYLPDYSNINTFSPHYDAASSEHQYKVEQELKDIRRIEEMKYADEHPVWGLFNLFTDLLP